MADPWWRASPPQSNLFFPEEDTLAFADAPVGYAPLAVFAGAYLLARELGAGPAGAAVAGVAFAYAPWRIDQQSRLNILSSGGIPLALVGWLYAAPYLDVRRDYDVERPPELVDFYPTEPRAFLAAPSGSTVWGRATAGVREELDWEEEQTLFPGLAILGLALVGGLARAYPRGLRIGPCGRSSSPRATSSTATASARSSTTSARRSRSTTATGGSSASAASTGRWSTRRRTCSPCRGSASISSTRAVAGCTRSGSPRAARPRRQAAAVRGPGRVLRPRARRRQDLAAHARARRRGELGGAPAAA